LVHTLILMTLLGWSAAMLLRLAMARQVIVHGEARSHENRALLAAAHAKVYTCLGLTAFPPGGSCAPAPDLSACLGESRLGARPYSHAVCPGAPPCRIKVRLCAPGEGGCPKPSCP
jgi:hypothetical protein